MKKVIFITAPDAEFGFGLAGIIQRVAHAEEAEAVLKDLIARPEVGLVVLDERLIRGVAGETLQEIEQGWNGILLVLPAPEKKGVMGEDYASRLIQRAIGYHVRL